MVKTAQTGPTFVVLGDGFSAGMGHFALEGSFQRTSFPALAARALGLSFTQPLVEPPGLGDVIGLESLPPVVPNVLQTTVLHDLPGAADLNNLSVPGFDAERALELRPRPPLVDRRSNLRTLANFVLGLPDLEHGGEYGRTQVEYARERRPDLALVCLGFDDLLRAAAESSDPERELARAVHRTERYLPRVISRLFSGRRVSSGRGADTRVLVATVPDPLDGAYFSTREAAARILKTTPAFLGRHWSVGAEDRVPLPTLYAMGYQTMGRAVGPLPCRAGRAALLSATMATALRAAVERTNDGIRRLARQHGAEIFELHAVVGRLRNGLVVDSRQLHADYLGGLYLLNGAYLGPTANAVVAEALVDQVAGFGAPRVPIDEIARDDANTLTRIAPGPPSTDAFLRPRSAQEIPPIPDPVGPVQPAPIQTTYPQLQPTKAGCTPAVGVPAAGLADPSYDDPAWKPLSIPAEGLDYTLDINPRLSCFGDALRPVDCPGEKPLIPGFPPFGTCQRTFFGGFLPTTSPLSGKIHIKIAAPDADGRSRFEIRHPGGLQGADADLTGPQLFRMPVQHTRVRDLPGLVSSGVLDTRTGRVYDFHYNLQNSNTALYSLVKLNPSLPPPVQAALLTFPGAPNGGSSWAELTPRPDGLFDLSIDAHMFVPMGSGTGEEPLRFALPFTTPDLDAASFVARGTSLHPRIFVTTRDTPYTGPVEKQAPSPLGEVPFNSVVEMTAHSNATYFGDAFDLHASALGAGGATGRSQLLGRVRAQFGERTGDTVAVVFQLLPPGGLLGEAPKPPPFLPPGTSRGGAGFDTVLHFPKMTYPQSGLASPDDPFNVCTTTLHLPTGRMVGPLLWRGYVVQALFAELIKVEPCTPADSFNYQGPARVDRGCGEGLVLHWNGTVFLPYPKGFKFPSSGPDGQPALTIEGDSRLDPFRSVRAVSPVEVPERGTSRGLVERARSPATGEEFSYRWSIPLDPERAADASFEYTDHTRGGHFELTSLSWLDVAWAVGDNGSESEMDRRRPGAEPEVLTFSGFGTWSLDRRNLHQISAQIILVGIPYVGIQVDGGLLSNVDIKPTRQVRA